MPRQRNNPRSRIQVPNLIRFTGWERKYRDLQREYGDLEHKFKKLKGDFNELGSAYDDLKKQHNDTLDEFHRLLAEKNEIEAEVRCLKGENAWFREYREKINDRDRSPSPPPSTPPRRLHGIKSKTQKTTCLCGEYFSSKSKLERHLRVKVRGAFRCDEDNCKKRFSSDYDARSHKKRAHNGHNKRVCRGCRMWFDTAAEFTAHRDQYRCRVPRIMTGFGAPSIREPDEDLYVLEI